MEKCVRCGINGEKVRLFDAVCNGRMSSICERCSIIENIPVIKKPDAFQLREAEKGVRVYKRTRRLVGITDEKKEKTFFIEDRLKELDKKPELELPEKNKLNLIEYYHWEIMKNRRRKGLSQKQLAESLGESEAVVQMIEKAKLPENAEVLVRKLEQFFQIKLRYISEMERIMERKKEEQKPVLLNEKGEELENIPEPEPEMISELELEEIDVKPIKFKIGGAEPSLRDKEIIEEEIGRDLEGLDLERGEFNINKADISAIKIADLKDLHKRRIEATRQEKIEEQRKIEERQRLVEARKEEIRLKKEKESMELDKILGGAELLREEGAEESIDEDSERRV